MLTGALRARRFIRFGTLGLYFLTFVSSFDSQLLQASTRRCSGQSERCSACSWSSRSAHARATPAVEFLIVLVLVGSASAVIQDEGLQSWRLSGLSLMAVRLSLDVVG